MLISAAGYVIVNLTVDLLYSFLNPRIRVAGARYVSYADPSIAAELNPRARRRRLMRKRFLRRPFAVIGLMVAVGFIVSGIFAPLIAPYHADTSDFTTCSQARRARTSSAPTSSAATPSRAWSGASRASIQAGVFATLLATLIAVPIGLAAGYYRGWIDPVIARVTDVLLAFPFLIVAVGLAAILGAVAPQRDDRALPRRDPRADPRRARRGARAARGGLRARRDRERRRRPAHPRQAHLPEHAADDHRADDGDDPRR